ncbi:MAG: hypothetical protein WAU24_13920, partial [Chitinophagaceae bacterium]
PGGLQALVDGTPFKAASIIEGLQQYMFYSETALRTASNNGEMPVIGKDLQAGADFMGKTRAELDAFVAANGDESTVGPLQEMLTNKLGTALGITGISVGFTCNDLLAPPDAPTAVPTGAVAGDTTKYLYKVVSTVSTVTNGTTSVKKTVPSAASSIVTNAAGPAAGKSNAVAWVQVAGATGYQVLRATQVGTTAPLAADYRLVAEVAGDTSSFTDPLNPTTAYTAATVNPILGSLTCADTTSVTKIEGVTLNLKLGQGTISADKGCEGDCIQAGMPLDLGLPGLSLKTGTPEDGDPGKVTASVGWSLDVAIGLNRRDGFYIDTSKVNELAVGASVSLDTTTSLQAQLAIIKVDVTKNGTLPEFAGSFGIDIKDGNNKLTAGEIARTRVADAIEVSVTAKVNLDWHLAASVDAAMPGVSTDFLLTWAWGASTSNNPKDTTGLQVQFNNVTLNTGEFFGQALKPYLQQVIDAAKPLQPVIDTIFTPMPVISDLSKAAGGSAVTIATLAEQFNTVAGGPQIAAFLTALKTVKQLLTVNCDGNNCGVVIGSFSLSRNRVATTSVSAGNATSMIDTKTPDASLTPDSVGSKDKTNQLKAPGANPLQKLQNAGLTIPVFADPTILFNLISGGDIELVEFDSGPLTLGFQFQKSFGPIYAPPPVMMVIGGGASVSMRIAAG